MMKLVPTDDPHIRTAGTDGLHIYYNYEWFENKLTLDQIVFVLAHEVMHISNLHHLRQGARDAKKWNVAGDYAINQLLKDCNIFELLPDALIDDQYKDLASEQIYDRLPEPPEGWGDGQDPGGCGGFMAPQGKDGKPLSEAERNRMAAETKIAVQQAAEAAKMQGKLPGELARWVGEMANPVMDWREILRVFIDKTAKNNYDWSRPNRRFVGKGIYLPSLRSDELKPIVVAVDTSGSIGNHELQQFSAELNDILQSYPCEVQILYCDTRIAHEEKFTSDQYPVEMKAHGGGGTDFRPPFEWVADNMQSMACLIYLTDMYCNSFPEHPDYPVLWVSTSSPGNGSEPPFGELAHLVE
jgi:predicted metal-dependent peptidase